MKGDSSASSTPISTSTSPLAPAYLPSSSSKDIQLALPSYTTVRGTVGGFAGI